MMKKAVLKKIYAAALAAALAAGSYGCGTATAPSSQAQTASSSAPQSSITVFAAASLTESFTQIAKDLKKSDNIEVKFNFAGSQTLAASMEQGADVDVAAFASESYMKEVKEKSLVDDYKIFTKNTLIACKLKSNQKAVSSLADFGKPGLSLIVGDPTVPCGSYFVKVLDGSKLTDAEKAAVNANIRSKEPNVKDVIAKIQSGNGDFGVVYTTDVTKEIGDVVEKVDVPEFAAAKPKYPIAVVKASKNGAAAQKFVDYVLSDQGKAVLESYGFITGE